MRPVRFTAMHQTRRHECRRWRSRALCCGSYEDVSVRTGTLLLVSAMADILCEVEGNWRSPSVGLI